VTVRCLWIGVVPSFGGAAVTALAAAVVLALAPLARPDQTQRPRPSDARPVEERVSRWERPEREAKLKPEEVLGALGLREGMAIADIGAGSGLFTRRFARAVGPKGKVYAVDISADILDYLRDRARKEGLANVEVIVSKEDDPMLPPRSVDLAFFCDTTHHIADRMALYANMSAALKDGARVAVIDYPPEAGSRGWTSHKPEELVPKSQVIDELDRAGFRFVREWDILPQNYFLLFERKPALAWLLSGVPGPGPGMAQTVEPSAFVCPMHPEILSTAAGLCPRCGMALVKGAADARDYRVEMETVPPAPRAGSPVRLRFTVRHPGHGGVVRDFAIVHDRAYHLFVVRQDLEDYQHVHPQSQADGSLVVDVVLARPGYYRVYSDFFPLGGTAQVVPGVLVTADAASDLGSSRARLEPDVVPERRTGDLVATLGLPSSGLVAGREENLSLRVQDARGAPVLDLEPYLGAYGHALVLSEDTLHYVHAHPVERLAPDAGAGGGPDLTFKALLPKPGRYRVWVQVKRAGEVSTLPFTVEVASPGGAGG